MEGRGLFRRKAATPAPTPVASTTTLRHPHTILRMWTKVGKISVWGIPVHQWRWTTLRNRNIDPRPSSLKGSSPMVTTVES